MFIQFEIRVEIQMKFHKTDHHADIALTLSLMAKIHISLYEIKETLEIIEKICIAKNKYLV